MDIYYSNAYFITSVGNSITETSTYVDKLALMSFFWAFIVIASSFNGIGIHIARLRNMSLLKTYTFIAGGKTPIILGIILNQFIYSLINVTAFTFVASIWLNVNFFQAIIAAIVIILIIFIPLAMVSLILTIIPVRDSTLSLATNISLYSLFLLAVNNPATAWMQWINLINPFTFTLSITDMMMYLFQITDRLELMNYLNIIFYLILTAVGWIAYKKLSLVSKDYRT